MPEAQHPLEPSLREQLAANLAGFQRRTCDDPGLRRAGVCIALVEDEAGNGCFVLTRRPATLRRHAGQWALPGGRLDDGETVPEAALRELREEVGLELEESAVLGLLDDYPTRSGFAITPVVVWGGRGCELVPDPQEVAALYRVRLEELEHPDVPQQESIPESSRPVLWIPLLGRRINAPTAALLYQFREVAMRGVVTRVDHFEQPVFAWK